MPIMGTEKKDKNVSKEMDTVPGPGAYHPEKK